MCKSCLISQPTFSSSQKLSSKQLLHAHIECPLLILGGNRSEQYYTHLNKITILNRGRIAEYFFLSCALSVAREAPARQYAVVPSHCQTPYYRILHCCVYQSNSPSAVVIFPFPIPDFCLLPRQVEQRNHACSSSSISSVTKRSNVYLHAVGTHIS